MTTAPLVVALPFPYGHIRVSGNQAVPFTREQLLQLYWKRARHYDFTANLYYLIGFREWAYWKKAVATLKLQSGDTVVEIGCGTGLNFPLLKQAIGPRERSLGRPDRPDAIPGQEVD